MKKLLATLLALAASAGLTAAELGLPLMEDNPYGDLWFDQPPPAPLTARNPEGGIYLGSFSKVLAPGFFAQHDMKTPARIAMAVLVITQCLNVVFVPLFQHAALTLTVGLGALINAVFLLSVCFIIALDALHRFS